MEKTGNTGSLGLVFAAVASGTALVVGKSFLSLLLRRQTVGADIGDLERRVNSLGQTVAEIKVRTRDLESARDQAVSRKQLDLAIEQAFMPLSHEMDRRFNQQREAVEALRIMIERTDELLGRVLEHLESAEDRSAAG